MTQIKIKRVYEPADESDGYRILVDKLWPRGIKKEDLHFDLWAKDITPSTLLRKCYHEDMVNHWEEFKFKYTAELQQSSAMKDFIQKISKEKIITLLYASKNAMQNHALILQDYLQGKLK